MPKLLASLFAIPIALLSSTFSLAAPTWSCPDGYVLRQTGTSLFGMQNLKWKCVLVAGWSVTAFAGGWQTVTNQNGHFTVIIQFNNPSLDPLLYDLYVTGQMINTDGAADYNGTLQGVIPKGTRTLQYSYVQPAIKSSGTGQFTLSQDGNSISGSGKAGDTEFTWNGTRAK